MSKKAAPKIGEIRLTEADKEIIARAMDSDFMKVIKKKIVVRRSAKIAGTGINMAQTQDHLWYYKGRLAEATWLVDFLVQTAKQYEADQEKDDDEETD